MGSWQEFTDLFNFVRIQPGIDELFLVVDLGVDSGTALDDGVDKAEGLGLGNEQGAGVMTQL